MSHGEGCTNNTGTGNGKTGSEESIRHNKIKARKRRIPWGY